MKYERTIVAQASVPNRSITILRSIKNFQTWYDIEIDIWKNNQVNVIVKDFLNVDQAFDYYDNYIKRFNLIEKECYK